MMKAHTIAIWFMICPAVLSAEPRTIVVTARSEIKVAPDEVLLALAIHTTDKTLLAAKRENDKIAAAVVAIAKKHTPRRADIKTINLDVSPVYDDDPYPRQRGVPVGYHFTRSIEVRITDFAQIEPFLAAAFDAGLNDVRSLHFRVSNQRQHQFEARRLAVKYAHEKATHLAELTGMQLGSPIRIEENVEHNWDAGGMAGFSASTRVTPRPALPAAERSQFTLTSFVDDTHKTTKMTDVTAPGQITIRAYVTIKYEMNTK